MLQNGTRFCDVLKTYLALKNNVKKAMNTKKNKKEYKDILKKLEEFQGLVGEDLIRKCDNFIAATQNIAYDIAQVSTDHLAVNRFEWNVTNLYNLKEKLEEEVVI